MITSQRGAQRRFVSESQREGGGSLNLRANNLRNITMINVNESDVNVKSDINQFRY